MSELKATLKADLTTATKAHDKVTLATLRMALTAITNEEVAGKEARVLSDVDVMAVLTKESKKRREAISAYTDANRPDLAAVEMAELAVLDRYLPEQLSETELAQLIADAVAVAQAAGQTGMKAMGIVMKELQPKVTGRADGSAVAAAVKQALGA
jgi:uncharacterized protein